MESKSASFSSAKARGCDLALVFLHYFSGAAVSWQWVIEKLEPNFRCVAFDLPGFGDAPSLTHPSLQGYATSVRQALAELELGEFVLIGHSMGGKIALQVAAEPRIKGLRQVVLVAPSPPTQEPMPQENKERLLNNHPSRISAETTVEESTQKELPDSRKETAIQTHMQAEESAWNWWLLEGMNNSIADQMQNVQVPVTVIASHDDPVIPYETIQQDVMGLLPKVELVELSGTGHLMPLEIPDEISQVIRQLVSRQGS
ncbi:MAG: alpha/beta fold hydrolase [Leptolyngbyaceae cyanobacterium]